MHIFRAAFSISGSLSGTVDGTVEVYFVALLLDCEAREAASQRCLYSNEAGIH